MSYFILMGRRIPKQAITGFKFQNETDNIRPFLSIRIRGKDEIIPFKDKKEIQSVKAHLLWNFLEMWQPIYGWNIRSLNKEVDCLI